jgi:hypothetical protein
MQSTLMIRDLPVSEPLDRKDMSAIRGGSALAGNVFGGGGFASPTIGIQIGPIVTTTDASQHVNVSVPNIQNFGGYQLGAV